MDIDGISYDLRYGGTRVVATLDNVQGNREEVYIPSEVTYEGKTYPVISFLCSQSNESWLGAGSVVSSGYQNTLKKITVAKGVLVMGIIGNFKELEEIVMEDPEDLNEVSFYNCPKLKSLYLPANFHEEMLIRRCPNLKLEIDPDNPYIKVIDNDIYSKNGDILYNVNMGSKDYKIKDGVKEIHQNAFYGNDTIVNLYMPDSVKKTGTAAFGGMKKLKSIRFSRSLKTLERQSFIRSMKLKKLILPSNIKNVKGGFGQSVWWCGLKKLYIRSANLKAARFGTLPTTCKVYVKNSTVKNQVRKFGFRGRIIVKSAMK